MFGYDFLIYMNFGLPKYYTTTKASFYDAGSTTVHKDPI